MRAATPFVLLLGGVLGACSAPSSPPPSPPTEPEVTGYRIVSRDGTGLFAVAGDAKRLELVRVMSDMTTAPLLRKTRVIWSGPPVVKVLPRGSQPPASILPSPGRGATGMWILNEERFPEEELAGVLWVLDAGTDPEPKITVTATVAEGDVYGEAMADVVIGQVPAADVARGEAMYQENCASCHGAPGADRALSGAWSTPLFAISTRSAMDDRGVATDRAMPEWLTTPMRTGRATSIDDFVDIHGFLKTKSAPAAQ